MIEQQVLLLYGELKLSDKDQAKIQKDLKFKAKLVKQQAKAEAAPSKKKAAKEAKVALLFANLPSDSPISLSLFFFFPPVFSFHFF